MNPRDLLKILFLWTLTQPVHAEDLLISMEEPVDGQVASGVSNIRGCAIASEGVSSIEVFVDGHFAFKVPYGGERKDVEAAYSTVANSVNLCLGQTFNYGLLRAGTH